MPTTKTQTRTQAPAPTPSAPDPGQAPPGRLDVLDESLLGLRRLFQRRGYRERLLADLSRPLEVTTLRLLRAVQRAGDAPSVGEVADTLTIDPSTASRVVDRAVESGLLERRACTDDRRRARLHLTAAGQDVLDEVTARRRQLLGEVTADWDAADLDRLVDLLSRLQEGFDRLESSA